MFGFKSGSGVGWCIRVLKQCGQVSLYLHIESGMKLVIPGLYRNSRSYKISETPKVPELHDFTRSGDLLPDLWMWLNKWGLSWPKLVAEPIIVRLFEGLDFGLTFRSTDASTSWVVFYIFDRHGYYLACALYPVLFCPSPLQKFPILSPPQLSI